MTYQRSESKGIQSLDIRIQQDEPLLYAYFDLPVMGFSRSTAGSLGSIGIFISFYFQAEIVVHVNVGQTVDQTVVKDQ